MVELAPGILIASPGLRDPNFEQKVVLLASHDEEGAFGFVLNGDSIMSLRELMSHADLKPSHDCSSGRVTVGGPVSSEQVWLAYPSEHRLAKTDGQFDVGDRIVATASKLVLERISGGLKLPGLRAFSGYAGWVGGQLEAEIQSGSWLPAKIPLSLVFLAEGDQGYDPVQMWQAAYRSLGTIPMAFVTRQIGSA